MTSPVLPSVLSRNAPWLYLHIRRPRKGSRRRVRCSLLLLPPLMVPPRGSNWLQGRPGGGGKTRHRLFWGSRKLSWKRPRIQPHFLIDFKPNFGWFLMPKSIRNRSQIGISLKPGFEVDFCLQNHGCKCWRENKNLQNTVRVVQKSTLH